MKMITLHEVKKAILRFSSEMANEKRGGTVCTPPEEKASELAKKWHIHLKNRNREEFNKAINEIEQKREKKTPHLAEVIERMNASHKSNESFTIIKHNVNKIFTLNKIDYDMSQFVCQHEIFYAKVSIIQTESEFLLCESKSEEALIKKINSVDKEKWDAYSIKSWKQKEIETLETNARFTKSRFGHVICDWHQKLFIAKITPNSIEEINCKRLIKEYEDSVNM